MKRRGFLAATGTAIATGLAGCSGVTGGNNNNNREGSTSKTNISVSISTEAEPSQLPSIWNDQSIEDFQAEFSVETSGGPTQATVSNGKVEINQESEQWNSNTVTVQPGQMNSGEQEFTATAEKNGTQAQDTTTATKPTPGNYKVDVVPERNEELRSTIENNSDEEDYLEARGNFVEQDPVFDTYSSHKAVGFDKLGIDLVAREWRHDNDYESLETGSPEASREFIQSIGTDTGNPDIQAIKNGNSGTTWYPNGNFSQRDAGHFDYQKFANAQTVGEALDQVHPYYFNWQSDILGREPTSAVDFIDAPVLEQAIEQKNNNDLEVHAWDFDLDEHGNGLIYGKNADGSDELRIMETVTNPVTASPANVHEQLHPLVEDSNYLNPEHDEFNRYWHPLRFGWEEHSNSTRWNFEEEKRRASQMIQNIATSGRLARTSGEGSGMETTETVAPTTEYLQDFTEKLRNYNQNDAEFQQLHNQAKIANELVRRDSKENFVIYGDTENPQYAVVEDDEVIEDIWEDEDGQYDDFNQFLRDNPSYSMSTEEIDATLEGEQTEDLSQQTLA
ncbi:hypothetical protein [Candidatus Nanohalovita haloferacivicina]|uniref:hypothetical protein n=1 Tax=Candidatus Nanohalovita haloferacivicina TaxID=2978046 RepID=UPI00325FA1A3|nr:Uncharacterized protein HBNXNv_0669 [Candidatus Nanohalobia archaeon BNXNv]